jgi:hypothetical protein
MTMDGKYVESTWKILTRTAFKVKLKELPLPTLSLPSLGYKVESEWEDCTGGKAFFSKLAKFYCPYPNKYIM